MSSLRAVRQGIMVFLIFIVMSLSVAAGGSYTFQTYAVCVNSTYLQGRIEALPMKWKFLTKTYFIGNQASHRSYNCDFVEGVVAINICRKQGAANNEIQDRDYGFCKQ